MTSTLVSICGYCRHSLPVARRVPPSKWTVLCKQAAHLLQSGAGGAAGSQETISSACLGIGRCFWTAQRYGLNAGSDLVRQWIQIWPLPLWHALCAESWTVNKSRNSHICNCSWEVNCEGSTVTLRGRISHGRNVFGEGPRAEHGRARGSPWRARSTLRAGTCPVRKAGFRALPLVHCVLLHLYYHCSLIVKLK